MIVECIECRKPFNVKPHDYHKRNVKRCSRECRKANRKNCVICGKEINKKPSSNLKYCSIECRGISRRGSLHPLYKNGFHITRHGYKLLKIKGKNILEHRLVMEKHLGRKLNKSEEIHHINRNKLDNQIENLMIVTKEEHLRIHEKERDSKGRFK